MRTVLSIAGSDCSGGAGIQADLKTITAYGMYGMTVITALTVQNTMGVFSMKETEEELLRGQLEAVFTDIRPDAVKIGMLASKRSVMAVAEALERFRPEHVVLDPVMVSTSGRRLMDQEAREALMSFLIPQASLVTPNIPEAEAFLEVLAAGRLQKGICASSEMEEAAAELGKAFQTSVLVKGGHKSGGADDCLYSGNSLTWFCGERLISRNTHGTGCTLSSAIACGLAGGRPMDRAVAEAKAYLTGALRTEPGLGHGNGPLNHCFSIPETLQWEIEK